METLDAKLNGIARKHGALVDDDAKPKPKTPDPTHKRLCFECLNGPALLESLCEPCYRDHYLVPLLQIKDKLISQLSDVDTKFVRHASALRDAKVKWDKAQKQNWRCKNCTKVFGYYGDLFEHEPSCKATTPKVRKASFAHRARSCDEDIA